MMTFWFLLLLLGFGFPVSAHAAGDPLAEVDGVVITSDEIDKPLAPQMAN